MQNPQSVTWRGASGDGYTYWVYQIPVAFVTGVEGNYVYSKLENNVWVPLYIGQGDLGVRANIEKHHQSQCLKSKGATHVHVHTNEREADRTAEECDLLLGHSVAFQPKGCNEKTWG